MTRRVNHDKVAYNAECVMRHADRIRRWQDEDGVNHSYDEQQIRLHLAAVAAELGFALIERPYILTKDATYDG